MTRRKVSISHRVDAFIRHSASLPRAEHSPAPPTAIGLLVARLGGMEQHLLDLQRARLSAAVGAIATAYDPLRFAETIPEPTGAIYTSAHQGGPSFRDEGLPSIRVTTAYRPFPDTQQYGHDVQLIYDPTQTVGLTMEHFRETKPHTFDTLADTLAGVPYGLREPYVVALESISAIMTQPDFVRQAYISPSSP